MLKTVIKNCMYIFEIDDIAVQIPASFSDIFSEIRVLKLISTKFKQTVATNDIREKPRRHLTQGVCKESFLNLT